MAQDDLSFMTIGEACRIIGGDDPIHPSTYYRGVKRGIFPAPVHLSPNVCRVVRSELLDALRARMSSGNEAA